MLCQVLKAVTMMNNPRRKTQTSRRSNRIEPGVQESPLLVELRRRLSEPEPWARRFRRLAEAIAQADDAESVSLGRNQRAEESSLVCEECEALLDLYVNDELAGYYVRHLYPLAWRHLQTCIRCRQAHDLIADTLRRERAGELPAVPNRETRPLSFLPVYSADTPWIARLRPRVGGAPFGLVFSFNLSYLRTLLSPPIPVAVRTEEARDSSATRLLLSDAVSVGEQKLAVEVTATQHPSRPEYLDLQAIITSSATLPEKLWARLTWADQTRSAPVDVQGQVDFGEVSLTKLQEALEAGTGNFEIAFESVEKVE
jgi:hypothetical protein